MLLHDPTVNLTLTLGAINGLTSAASLLATNLQQTVQSIQQQTIAQLSPPAPAAADEVPAGSNVVRLLPGTPD